MRQQDFTHTFMYWVKRVYLLANQRADDQLRAFGLGRTQWHIVHHLAHNDRLGQKQLQELLRMESATLTPIIATMVQRGWVEQQASHEDKRRKDLILTDKGRHLWQAVPSPVEHLEKMLSKNIPPQDLAKVREILEVVAQNLET